MNLGKEIVGDYALNQIGEWIAFFLDFFVRYQVASFIRYTTNTVPQA